MGWFSWGSEERFRQASDAIERWWDSIEGTQHPHEVIIYATAERTILLCGSTRKLITEHTSRYGGEPLPNTVAGWRRPGVIAMLFKRTNAGKVIINQWALGHEDWHDINDVLGLNSNPDDVTKAEFY